MEPQLIEETQVNNCTISIYENPKMAQIMPSPREEGENIGTIVYGHREYQIGEVKVESEEEAWDYIFTKIQNEITDEDWHEIVSMGVADCENTKVTYDDKFWQDYSGDYRQFAEDERLHEQLIRSSHFAGDFMGIICRYAVVLDVFMLDHPGISIPTRPFGCHWDSGKVGLIFTTYSNAEEANVLDAKQALRDEIKTLNKFIQGEIYEFTVVENETERIIDSCSGIMGDIEFAREEAYRVAKNKPQQELGTV